MKTNKITTKKLPIEHGLEIILSWNVWPDFMISIELEGIIYTKETFNLLQGKASEMLYLL